MVRCADPNDTRPGYDMATPASSRESVNRLALSCSALARAGQILSTVTDPGRAADALGQATRILEDDARSSSSPQIIEAVSECRDAVESAADVDAIAQCRRLATQLARRASSLATEVQQQSKKGVVSAAARTVPPVRAPSVPAVPVSAPPAPRESPRRDIVREPDPGRISVAVTAEEKAAVLEAMKSSARFAVVGNGTVIDLKTNLAWLASGGPAGTYSQARDYVATRREGGHGDWRLPRPDEVQQLLSGGGAAWARSNGMLRSGGSNAEAAMVWTQESKWRWLRFRREVTVIQLSTGAIALCAAGRRDVGLFGVRGRR
jgi:hypothetical protein